MLVFVGANLNTMPKRVPDLSAEREPSPARSASEHAGGAGTDLAISLRVRPLRAGDGSRSVAVCRH